MVGHDLRNPLQAITNAVSVLKEAAKKLDSRLNSYQEVLSSLQKPIPSQIRQDTNRIVEERFDIIHIIDESVDYANKVVTDLQDYARPLKPEPVETSLHQLINDILSSITVPETVKVSTAIEENFPKLMVDPALMKRVFINIITNALQAMPDRGRLTIRASKTEETAFISIQDTSVGIPEENLPKLFQPLYTTKAKGTGFGLAVCRRLVEAHDGSITVESEVDRGSTFTVQIPLKRR